MSGTAEVPTDGSIQDEGEGSASSKRPCKVSVLFTNDLKTLLGRTIHEQYSKYSSVLRKGNHDKAPALQSMVDLINQHLRTENPGKGAGFYIDKKILSGWILKCVQDVAE